MSPRGRFAPSPTGDVHLGNAASALVAWLSVRSRGGSLVLRIEDLDRDRARGEFTERIVEDLGWLGLDWDEGPYDQSSRTVHYHAAFERLRAAGRLYPCFCSRKEIAAAASAPQEPGDEQHYPGTCATLDAAESARRVARGERHAWRFRVGSSPRPEFVDRLRGPWHEGPWPCGDFVVHRSDGVAAYQLAVVVDDAAMGIDEVVRGDDLLPSTPRQLLLYEALGLRPPVFGHVPLLLGPDGVRLSKRHRGTTVRELRAAGLEPPAIVGRLAHLLGLRPAGVETRVEDLVADFAWDKLRQAPGGIIVES